MHHLEAGFSRISALSVTEIFVDLSPLIVTLRVSHLLKIAHCPALHA